ncbi:MAG TPA: S24/S26 family peptidase [Candidatus Acidoferrum sp.]|nr:S24/S26 family peptidase [Candidatus Acidoferrum sp.]
MSAAATQVTLDRTPSPQPHASPDPARMIIEKLRERKSACFRVNGRSMWPALRPGDLVFAKALDIERVSFGQVVAFERDGRVFVHRVIRRIHSRGASGGPAALRTKGDTLDGPDPTVSMQEYLGCVIRVHRGRRHIDMESLGHRAAGKAVAAVSPASRLIFGPLRALRAAVRSL